MHIPTSQTIEAIAKQNNHPNYYKKYLHRCIPHNLRNVQQIHLPMTGSLRRTSAAKAESENETVAVATMASGVDS